MKPYYCKLVLQKIEDCLLDELDTPSLARKRLEPNPLSTWELKVGEFRVFYDVDRPSNTVTIQAIGYKPRNVLYIDGKEYPL